MSLFKKEESKKENGYDSNDNVVEKKEVVSCNDCKCLLYEIDSQKILSTLYNLYLSCGRGVDSYEYYCNTHRRNYEKVHHFFTEKIYFKEMQVDKNGEPIGYKKIKSNE